ncbi:glycerophosphodiester phosphodiesterase family protein [Tepidamorphus sp. 3E244]|uniref:glycerophosphodiester phosphodiesterase family protein n=1 Tax=Tepidamorphus sp. 3E244 TaxID=3385498 RepID=UPI0038FC98A4
MSTTETNARGWIGRAPVAHRGLHDKADGRIENSLSAIRAAVEAGFAIEIDVRQSADGEVMVFHDATLDRLTGETGAFTDRNADELTGMELTGSGGDTIPRLSDVLGAVDGRVPLYVEIKHETRSSGARERAVAKALDGYDGPVAAMSFEPSSVRAMREVAPHITRGIVGEAYRDKAEWPGLSAMQRFSRRNLFHILSTAPHFIAWHIHDLPAFAPVIVNTLTGKPLLAWTVRSPAEAERARASGAQIIFENFLP